MKITQPDENRANAYAEHVLSALVARNKADQSITTDVSLKQMLATWLVFLSEVHPKELDDPIRFVKIALEHQRSLIGIANEKQQKGASKGEIGNLHENARAISFWNPILIPFAAKHLTGDNQIFESVFGAYWLVFSEERTTELFPELPLDQLMAEITDLDEITRNRFLTDMRWLTRMLIEEHYVTAYASGLTGEDPEQYTDHLFAIWETLWQDMANTVQSMDQHTMRLLFLLMTLGPMLACDHSVEYAGQIAVLIKQRTKCGWHGYCPNIEA